MTYQLISQEEFTSVQKAQAGITRLFKKAAKNKTFYRVMRNQEPLGVIIPNNTWLSLIEDLEALSSQNYMNRIAQSRRSRKHISASQIEKELNINND